MTAPSATVTRRPVQVRCRACHRIVAGYLEVVAGQETKLARPYRHDRTGVTGGACRGSNRPATPIPADLPAPTSAATAKPAELVPLVSRAGWRWFGYGGHLVVSSRCAFHLATLVGGVLVSTIGHWLPKHGDAVEEIGSGRTFETMVFRCSGVDAHGNPEHELEAIEATSYNDSVQAERGHYAICERWHQRQLQ